MKNRLMILGSGTSNLNPDKSAASVLIEKDSLRLVYDFGRGTSLQLTKIGLQQDDVSHVFISHFHPDHNSDLIPYLHAASWSQIDKRSQPLHIYGQPGTPDFLQRLFSAYDQNYELTNGFELDSHEVSPGEWQLGGQAIIVMDLHHSFGLRLGDYAIAGDADVSDDLIKLLTDAKLAVFDAGHISDAEIVDVAVATQVQTLVCSHQYRPLDQAALNNQAKAKGFNGNLVVAQDLMEFEL